MFCAAAAAISPLLMILTAVAQHRFTNQRFALIQRMLPRHLIESNDESIGAGQGGGAAEFHLWRVITGMRRAESALATADVSGHASATQQEVIAGLDVILTRLQKQCDQCCGGGLKQSSAHRSPSKPARKPGVKPGETAATTPAVATARPVSRQAISKLVLDVWGQLPERQREEMLQPLSEEFLPQYAEEIEAYFAAFAELPDEAPVAEAPR